MVNITNEIAKLLIHIFGNENNGLDAFDAIELLGNFYDNNSYEIKELVKREEDND